MIMIYSNGITRYILFNIIHFLIFYEITFNVFWKSKIPEYYRALRNSTSLTFSFSEGQHCPVHQITINQNPLKRAACKVAPRLLSSAWMIHRANSSLGVPDAIRVGTIVCVSQFAESASSCCATMPRSAARFEISYGSVRGVRCATTIILDDGSHRRSD